MTGSRRSLGEGGAVRLQKVLAERGLASRRGAEKLIADGLVRVNGSVVTEMGVKVDPGRDLIEVDEAALGERKALHAVLILHKPLGYVCTRGTGEGKNVMELIRAHPQAQSMNPVGRLDKDSTGLILLTNDGPLQYAIVNPDTHLEKEYEVRFSTPLAKSQADRMEAGVTLDGKKTRPCKVKRLTETLARMTLTEGRNRQIRRMASKVGLEVAALKRLRVGPLNLGSLKEGAWRELDSEELSKLKDFLRIPMGEAKAGNQPG